jgi:hypothetical protein
MDEKSQNNPETQTEPESSGHIDSIPVNNDIEQNIESFENVESESESIASEMKATPDHAIDNPETTRPLDKAPKDTGQESADPETEGAHEALLSSSNDDDDVAAPEKEGLSGTEEVDDDGGGVDTTDVVKARVAQSDPIANDEVEEIREPSEEKVEIDAIDEKQENKGDFEDDDPAAQTQIELETADAEEKKDNIAEGKTIQTPARKSSVLKVAVSAIVIVAAFSGFFLFDNKSKVKATSQQALSTSKKTKISPSRHKKTEISKPATSKISSIYNAKIEEITALRDRLLLKQEEIMRLKKRYQDGVEELENEISDELQKKESNTFLQAMDDKAIAFTLRTIQRRQAYVQQLEGPAKWIHLACEELLYIKRRTLMDLQVAEIAAGIDMNKHVRLINAAVRKYQPTADKLAPDMTNAQLEPLETIWNRIQDKIQLYASVRAHSQNQIISDQICTGNFKRLNELSEISAETAKCITEMQASDLFLNRLAEISPAAARQLFQWKGSWVCLNGVRALSPRAAHYLFQWDGNWISLNGLTEFPAEIGETLLHWNGRQLELMGLQYSEDYPASIALEYLARWERDGGKLFVPQIIRKKIDEMHRHTT